MKSNFRRKALLNANKTLIAVTTFDEIHGFYYGSAPQDFVAHAYGNYLLSVVNKGPAFRTLLLPLKMQYVAAVRKFRGGNSSGVMTRHNGLVTTN